MWLLPSLNRPKEVERFVYHYKLTKASLPVVIWINDNDKFRKEYEKIKYPSNFELVKSKPMYVGQIMQSFFVRYPNLPFYGYLSDDVIPRTLHWDKRLAERARSWNLAYPNDLMPTELTATLMKMAPRHIQNVKDWSKYRFPELQNEQNPNCNFPVLGGELVRAVGWLMVDSIKHFATDTLWQYIALTIGTNTYCRDICLEHMHMDFGKSSNDATYQSKRGGDEDYGKNYEGVDRDNQALNDLLNNPQFKKLLKQVKAKYKKNN